MTALPSDPPGLLAGVSAHARRQDVTDRTFCSTHVGNRICPMCARSDLVRCA